MAYILVVDDDEDFASVVGRVLEDAGHEVEIQLDTKSAGKRIGERRPDLLVLDVMFPEDSTAGFDLARSIRQKHEHIPVLLLTAVNARFPLGLSSRDINDQWMPVTDFMEKPVDLDVLVEKVTALLVATNK